MNHYNGSKCTCSIFRNKNISLKILVIHKIIVEIEESLLKCRHNTEILTNKYRGTVLEKFTFHAKVKFETPSMYHNDSFFITECYYLDNYYFCFIEMFDKISYDQLKVEFFNNPYWFNYVVYPLE